MRPMLLTLNLIPALVLGVAAAEPDWLSGASRNYPRERYMVGVGSGEDRASAEDRARGEISRIFSSLVTVKTSLTETEQNRQGPGKTDASFSQSVSQNVETLSKKLLEGVEVVENWKDPATKRHFALAVLEREKGIAAVKEKIAAFDAQAGEWKKQMDEASAKLPRVKAALKLMALFKAREELNSELRVLDASGKGEPNPLNEALVRPQASKALSALEVFVDVTGSNPMEIETGIVKGLNAFGLEARAGGAPGGADILVEGQMTTTTIEMDKKWRWARSSVTVSLKDGETSKIFLRFDASERQAAADQKEATRRSLSKLSKKLSPTIHAAITEYFENQ